MVAKKPINLLKEKAFDLPDEGNDGVNTKLLLQRGYSFIEQHISAVEFYNIF